MEQTPNGDAERLGKKVQRHSPDRLLRQMLVLPGGVTVSAEKHRGRLVVRVESPDEEGYAAMPSPHTGPDLFGGPK